MNSRPLWPAWTREPNPSSSWNHATPPPPSKANCLSRLSVTSSNRRLEHLLYQTIVNEWSYLSQNLSKPFFMFVFINHGLRFRSQSIKEMSVRFSTTLSPSSGGSWTTMDTRRWCPLSASLYLQSTRRPQTVYPGENTVKQNNHLRDR